MPHAARRGFTLIELMVTIAVLTILLIIAIPSFVELRERVAVRGAGDQLTSFWANARLEAVKRDTPVTISIHSDSAGLCVGASTTGAACDCTPTGTSCNVGKFPGAQSEWRGVTAVGNPTLGPNDADADGVATIDPKRGQLTDPADVGGITIQSPVHGKFRMRLYVDRWARAYLCVPTDSPLVLSDYSNRTCAP